ncbi:MAG: DMT family transporter [Gemmatimonadaceae bacterium]|nr:DMT family transporter [Gemmatimonadaceae bacterium]
MQLKQWGAFILLGLIWGTSFVWIKIAVAEISPFTLVAFRLTVAFLGLLVIMRLTGQSFPRDRKTWPAFAVMGLLNTALPFTLISWGETRIASGLASILNGTVPLFIIVIAHFWLHDEKIALKRLSGLLVGFVGTVILVSRDIGLEGLHGNLWGQLAVIAASASYATAYTFARRYMRGTSPVVQSAMQMLIGGSIMWLSFPAAAAARPVVPLAQPVFSLPALPLTWVAIVWLGLLGSCLAFVLMFYLVNEWGPTRASVVTYIFPIVGLILGLVLLNETLDWRLLGGSALIVAGIGVMNLRPPARRAPAAAPAMGRGR